MRYVFNVVGIFVKFIGFIWYLLGEYWPVAVIIAVNLVIYFAFQYIGSLQPVRAWLDRPITDLTIGNLLSILLIGFGLLALYKD